MIGYLFVLCAVLANTVKGYGSKRVSGRMSCLADNVDLSILRNALCAALGALFILLAVGADYRLPPLGWLICGVAGIAVSASYTAWVIALKTDAYMFASATNTASFIVSALGGILFFAERPTPCKGLAVLLILIGMLFMLRYQIRFGGRPGAKGFLLLLLLFFSAGISALTQKWFTRELPALSVHLYTFYSFLLSTLLLLVFRMLIRTKRPRSERASHMRFILPWVAVMGIALYATTYFQARASASLDAIVLYPLNNGLTLIAGCMMAWIFFRERPDRYSIIGGVFVFAAMILSRF